jgi:hypothetical protein
VVREQSSYARHSRRRPAPVGGVASAYTRSKFSHRAQYPRGAEPLAGHRVPALIHTPAGRTTDVGNTDVCIASGTTRHRIAAWCVTGPPPLHHAQRQCWCGFPGVCHAASRAHSAARDVSARRAARRAAMRDRARGDARSAPRSPRILEVRAPLPNGHETDFFLTGGSEGSLGLARTGVHIPAVLYPPGSRCAHL